MKNLKHLSDTSFFQNEATQSTFNIKPENPESPVKSDTAKMAIEEDEETAMQWLARSGKMTGCSG